MKINILLLLIILLATPVAYAAEGSMTLLAASAGDDSVGSTADLKFELVAGKGRVFIDTFPLTKMDTQISTRFAKEIACSFLNTNCGSYDFIYTIRSHASILGGPSASAAITVLTISLLEDLELDEKTAITGTINSGGLIGPVGGLTGKIEAASRANLTTVLIPDGERMFKEDNETIDLVEYGLERGVDVYEVSTLEEALFHFTGKSFELELGNLTVNPMYNETMNDIANMLCGRSRKLMSGIGLIEDSSTLDDAVNLTRKAKKAMEEGKFYSAASFCYGANVKLRYLELLNQNLNEKQIRELVFSTRVTVFEFNEQLDNRTVETINDLQTNMIVKERLKDAKNNLDDSIDMLNDDELDEAIYKLASAVERHFSAQSWSKFFDKGSEKYDVNIESLEHSCISKISEASERIEYVKLFAPSALKSTSEELDYAHIDKNKGDYDLCLFKASKAKAEADLIIGVIGVLENQTEALIDKKLALVEDTIIKQDMKGIFPIMGFSYYEYAQSLKDNDYGSSLLYAEYALELSNLDIYFKVKNDSVKETPVVFENETIYFIAGLVLGVLITLAVTSVIVGKKKKRRKKGINRQ